MNTDIKHDFSLVRRFLETMRGNGVNNVGVPLDALARIERYAAPLSEAEKALERIAEKIAYPLGGPTDSVTDARVFGQVNDIARTALLHIRGEHG